jgi:4-diphosphocytidyl-2-C-methyl-D-erythritol kinase
LEQHISLPAFAKINLSLRVLGRRADGYHEISTVFQTITLQDRLTFREHSDGRFELTCTDPTIPVDESNLVYKAAAALRARYGITRGARVELEKTIPAGGGLGGGSSDAAAALIGLCCLWGLGASRGELCEIGARLGADVPFFLTGGTALGTGTGTDIEPLEDAPEKHLVIVAPPVHVSTAEAYKALKAPALTKDEGAASLSVSRAESKIADSPQSVAINDFEPVVFCLYPEIERARARLIAAGARRAMLSGSGASVFGVFDGEAEARQAGAALEMEGERGWRIFRCATLSRVAYVGAFGRCAGFLR